ncbi:hypothetical protein LSH36_107g13036 [Paralvinella palmiformis]|uniref:Uncharacterized protein n=1 Tax=Paralvinella palmiformis TaxID=53620 RepID=A0AAD9N9F0_9ANNE|nr:hypothetical protein LSH36_107g13036 [Paralvinella palmiformis]
MNGCAHPLSECPLLSPAVNSRSADIRFSPKFFCGCHYNMDQSQPSRFKMQYNITLSWAITEERHCCLHDFEIILCVCMCMHVCLPACMNFRCVAVCDTYGKTLFVTSLFVYREFILIYEQLYFYYYQLHK